VFKGDTYAVWRSHQTKATSAEFEELFAALANDPGAEAPAPLV
jgi:hypothetical protein